MLKEGQGDGGKDAGGAQQSAVLAALQLTASPELGGTGGCRAAQLSPACHQRDGGTSRKRDRWLGTGTGRDRDTWLGVMGHQEQLKSPALRGFFGGFCWFALKGPKHRSCQEPSDIY